MNCTDSTESGPALSKLITKYHASGAYQVAAVNAFRNQSDEAFEWLDRAYAQRDERSDRNESGPVTEELTPRPAIHCALEEAQLAELTFSSRS
jgi:hypothetical protein